MYVKVRNNNVESALRVFKKRSSEVIFEVRERESYESPSAKRHRAKKSAIARERRRQAAQVHPGRDRKF